MWSHRRSRGKSDPEALLRSHRAEPREEFLQGLVDEETAAGAVHAGDDERDLLSQCLVLLGHVYQAVVHTDGAGEFETAGLDLAEIDHRFARRGK